MTNLSIVVDAFSISGNISVANWTFGNWHDGFAAVGSANAIGGVFQMGLATSTSSHYGLVTNSAYSLDYAFAKLILPPTTAAGVVAHLGVAKPAFRTIAQVVADTSLSTEAVAVNQVFGWQGFPAIVTPAPKGSAIASFWVDERPTWLFELNSWWSIFEGSGNTATNTRIEVKNMRIFVLSEATRTWALWDYLQNAQSNTSVGYYSADTIGFIQNVPAGDKRLEPSGGTSLKVFYPQMLHGYGNSGISLPGQAGCLFTNTAACADVRAVFSAVDCRLVIDNSASADDRDSAIYLCNSAADYYPDENMTWSTGWAPGVGAGRYLRVSKQWRTPTMVVLNTFDFNVTMGEILANPPPLEAHSYSSKLTWTWENNALRVQAIADNYTELSASISYNSSNHAWFRIRESSNTIFFDTAPLAAADPPLTAEWSTNTSLAIPFEKDAVRGFIGGGNPGASATPGSLQWDGFNTATSPAIETTIVSGFLSCLGTGR